MALIAIAADKGAPGVTTTAVALAAVWPRPVLLAECDPAGGDLVYWLPGADGSRLDPRRGLLSLAVTARRGLQPQQIWEHTQKLLGGLDVLPGVTNAEQGAGLEPLWDTLGAMLSSLPGADVIADCGRIGPDGPLYGLLAYADMIALISRARLGDVVRLRDRSSALAAGLRKRGGRASRVGLLVIADHKSFNGALAEVSQAMEQGGSPVSVLGGIAYEPRSADMLRGEWGGKLDKSLLIRTARQVAGQLAAQLPGPGAGAARTAAAAGDPGPAAAGPAAKPPAAGPALPQPRSWQPQRPAPAPGLPQRHGAAPDLPHRPADAPDLPQRPGPVPGFPEQPEFAADQWQRQAGGGINPDAVRAAGYLDAVLCADGPQPAGGQPAAGYQPPAGPVASLAESSSRGWHAGQRGMSWGR